MEPCFHGTDWPGDGLGDLVVRQILLMKQHKDQAIFGPEFAQGPFDLAGQVISRRGACGSPARSASTSAGSSIGISLLCHTALPAAADRSLVISYPRRASPVSIFTQTNRGRNVKTISKAIATQNLRGRGGNLQTSVRIDRV